MTKLEHNNNLYRDSSRYHTYYPDLNFSSDTSKLLEEMYFNITKDWQNLPSWEYPRIYLDELIYLGDAIGFKDCYIHSVHKGSFNISKEEFINNFVFLSISFQVENNLGRSQNRNYVDTYIFPQDIPDCVLSKVIEVMGRKSTLEKTLRVKKLREITRSFTRNSIKQEKISHKDRLEYLKAGFEIDELVHRVEPTKELKVYRDSVLNKTEEQYVEEARKLTAIMGEIMVEENS